MPQNKEYKPSLRFYKKTGKFGDYYDSEVITAAHSDQLNLGEIGGKLRLNLVNGGGEDAVSESGKAYTKPDFRVTLISKSEVEKAKKAFATNSGRKPRPSAARTAANDDL